MCKERVKNSHWQVAIAFPPGSCCMPANSVLSRQAASMQLPEPPNQQPMERDDTTPLWIAGDMSPRMEGAGMSAHSTNRATARILSWSMENHRIKSRFSFAPASSAWLQDAGYADAVGEDSSWSGWTLGWSVRRISRSIERGSRDKKLVRLWHRNRVACSLLVVATIPIIVSPYSSPQQMNRNHFS